MEPASAAGMLPELPAASISFSRPDYELIHDLRFE